MTLALVIEASMEAYFQFWLQSNYSLPDFLIKMDSELYQDLVNKKTVSILLCFITITISIIKIRSVLIELRI